VKTHEAICSTLRTKNDRLPTVFIDIVTALAIVALMVAVQNSIGYAYSTFITHQGLRDTLSLMDIRRIVIIMIMVIAHQFVLNSDSTFVLEGFRKAKNYHSIVLTIVTKRVSIYSNAEEESRIEFIMVDRRSLYASFRYKYNNTATRISEN